MIKILLMEYEQLQDINPTEYVRGHINLCRSLLGQNFMESHLNDDNRDDHWEKDVCGKCESCRSLFGEAEQGMIMMENDIEKEDCRYHKRSKIERPVGEVLTRLDLLKNETFWRESMENAAYGEMHSKSTGKDPMNAMINKAIDLMSELSKAAKPVSEDSKKQGYHDVEEFYKDELRCPQCDSVYIMEHRHDSAYKICMSCKYNWKT